MGGGLLLLLLLFAMGGALPVMVEPVLVEASRATIFRSSNQSRALHVEGTGYALAPLVVKLKGSRRQIGFDYAKMLHTEASQSLRAFFDAVVGERADVVVFELFLDFCWDKFLSPRVPQAFLDELAGMRSFPNPDPSEVRTDVVAQRFYTLANLPADRANIVAMLEEELEPASWPFWLKDALNDVIGILERIVRGCDAFGAWGSRTARGQLYSSRNLDFNTNTGIDRFKTVVFYEVDGVPPYVSLGFAVGLGALAGQSSRGMTVSEMNLDNSVVTFSGPPFPLRLRMVLEGAGNLREAMGVWNATNNTNSFNFLLASASDGRAVALETIRGFTQVYGDNSPIERDATYLCQGRACRDWTNRTGLVRIGGPLPECVFRSNHAFSPIVMLTQEPLFNDTTFRYWLQHDLFSELQKQRVPVDDGVAVAIAATLGTKGVNFLTCNQDYSQGANVMSIAYMPGPRLEPSSSGGHFFVAWEQGKGSDRPWVPAACNPYVKFSFDFLQSI